MHNPWKQSHSWIADAASQPIYRGFERTFASDVEIIASPMDRVPKHMPCEVQVLMDDWFEARFSVRFRQRSIFSSGSIEIARDYAGVWGEVRSLTPRTNYAFCWSHRCPDLYGAFEAIAPGETIEALLDRLEFTTDDISGAIRSGCEVMLVCASVAAQKIACR